jgi:hypothetical protein
MSHFLEINTSGFVMGSNSKYVCFATSELPIRSSATHLG